MRIKGVTYDVGSEMGGNWRPDYDPTVVRRDLGIIRKDLHCNAVEISGKDIKRLITTAETALKQGLDVWLSPTLWNKSPEETLRYVIQVAAAAQPLNERYPGKMVFVSGSEAMFFMQGIVPGRTLMQRIRFAFGSDFLKSGAHNALLNEYLEKAAKAVRGVFGGNLTYSALMFEKVDWTWFDIVSVHHYWSEQIQDRYITMAKPLFAFEKPVVNTEFGFDTTNAPVVGGALSFGHVNGFSLVLHRLPVIGKHIRPRLNVVHERDEALQAKRLAENLRVLDQAGFDGAFVSTFIFPLRPYSDIPKNDLDRESASLVKYYDDGRHGMTYPDMLWEPKESFKAVANYYANN